MAPPTPPPRARRLLLRHVLLGRLWPLGFGRPPASVVRHEPAQRFRPRQREHRRGLAPLGVVLLATSLATLAAVDPAAAAAPGSPPAEASPRLQRGRLWLASQTAWVVPGQEFDLRVMVHSTEDPGDLSLVVSVYPRATSRSAFRLTLDAPPRGPALKTLALPLVELRRDAAGARFVSLVPHDSSSVTNSNGLVLRQPGVYPVSVALREVNRGPVLDRITTHLLYMPASTEGPRLQVAWVQPVHQPPALRPDGTRRLPARASASLGDLATALEAHPKVPLVLKPTPETVEALASSQRESDRAAMASLVPRSPENHQVVVGPYVPVSLPALFADGMPGEAAAQLDTGARILSQSVQPSPALGADRQVWVADEPLDEAAVATLRRRGFTRFVLPEKSLQPVSLPVTLTETFQLDGRQGQRQRAAVADEQLSAHFAQDDPVLAAHQLLADLAVVYFDKPGRARGLVLVAPRRWRPNRPFLDAALSGLELSPILTATTLDGFFSTVPTSKSPRGTTLSRRLVKARATPTAPAENVRRIRGRLDAVLTTVDATNLPPVVELLQKQLLVAQSADLRTSDARDYLRQIDEAVDGRLALIHIPPNRSIALTARVGEIPVTIQNHTGHPVRATLRVESDKLDFPGGGSHREVVRPVLLARRNTTQRFAVTARAAGAFPLRVRLESPDGRLVLGESRFTVHSTATSAVGVVLSAGAGSFLLLWWARHGIQRRRQRRSFPG